MIRDGEESFGPIVAEAGGGGEEGGCPFGSNRSGYPEVSFLKIGSTRLWTAAAAILLCLLSAGCRNPGEPAGPPVGGREYLLDAESFRKNVIPVLTSSGCNQTGPCHGGGIRGTYALSPPMAIDSDFDFEQTIHQVNPYRPGDSPLLRKPLAAHAGGTAHSWEPFDSPTTPGYLTILEWIESGEFAK